MSSVELLNIGKKILGKLPKTVFSEYDYPLDRLMDLIAPRDHVFYPLVEVGAEGKVLNVDAFVHRISVDPTSAPVKFNIDRPVTDQEYSVVFPGVVKVISRLAGKVYLKAPLGQTSKVTVECLKVG